jgi:hypothetical protein
LSSLQLRSSWSISPLTIVMEGIMSTAVVVDVRGVAGRGILRHHRRRGGKGGGENGEENDKKK